MSKQSDLLDREIRFWVPQFGAEEKAAVAAVVDSGFLNEGDVTAHFERELADLLGCRHVIATTSGTSAIFLALAALGVGPGDEAIVPNVTFIATANAVMLAGARPILADVDPLRLTLDPDSTERAITTRTKVIIPVHVSGRAAHLGAILNIANHHGLHVLEDSAEAFMSRHENRCLGTFGIAGCFSLSPNKTITTGQGGFIATDDDKLHVRLRELKDQGRPIRGTGGDDSHNSVGFNFKFTNLQAAVGLAQLQRLAHRLERMRRIHRGYVEGLRSISGISPLPFCVDDGEVPQWTDVLVDHRDVLYDQLAARGIRCRRFWHPLNTQPPYRMPSELFPNSSRSIPHAMWLPSAFTLSDLQVNTICQQIRDLIGRGTQYRNTDVS